MKRKKRYLVLLLICPLFLAMQKYYEQIDEATARSVETGIVLDSMNNKVLLQYESGKPAYYFSHVFTPVCNTGECLPVFVNIYWKLDGTYLKFDQPQGEILTKLDHVPFTEEDYLLLDEILRGPDPRYAIELSHGSEVKHDKGDQSNPAPSVQSKKMLSKYEMVDGVTGATAIQHTAKFVPGALYTTYTLWGLANDCHYKLQNYSKQHLMTKENTNYFITHPEHGLQYLMFEKLFSESSGENARPNLLMTMMDTADVQLSNILLNYVYYDYYQLDTVIHTLDRKFFSTDDVNLKRRILSSWTYNYCAEYLLFKTTAVIAANEEILYEYINLLSVKTYWPEGVLTNLLSQMEHMSIEKRQWLLEYLKTRKDFVSSEDWKKIQAAEKRYK